MIVVFGSLNLDHLFRVARLPRPGETVLASEQVVAPGGKGGNQAVAAARAGARVVMVGRVGRDAAAPLALAELERAGVDLRHVGRSALPTGAAAIAVDAQGENTIVVAAGANRELVAADLPEGLLGPDTWLLVQMEVPAAETWRVVERAKARGARVLLNLAPAAPVPPEVLDALDALVLNEGEAATLGGDGGAESVARALAARHGFVCVVTLGAAGAVAASRDGAWRVGALPVAPVDTTGAGDAFVGALAAALDRGLGLSEALRRAGVAAGLACRAVGCQPAFADAAAIDRHLGELPPAQRR